MIIKEDKAVNDFFERRGEVFIARPGTYLIGDLCYVSEEVREGRVFDWDKFLDDAEEITESFRFGMLGGYPAIQFFTRHGDGFYLDNWDREFPVDSGGIGILPWKAEYGEPEGCYIVEFEDPMECFMEANTIFLGDSYIDTDPAPESDDDIDDEEEPNPPTI